MTRLADVQQLGAGGMGVVYRAFDRERNAWVALKTVGELDADSIYRFKKEFRSVAGLDHENLVPLYELISHRGRLFFTMELIEDGVDLAQYLWRHGGRPGSPSFDHLFRDLFRQLVEGTRVLHRAGIVHRDIKPGNVLVRKDGRVVLLDFGLAGDLRAEPPGGDDSAEKSFGIRRLVHQTTDHKISGTAVFMAPEQAAGRALTQAADWYAVGVMMYLVLTGGLPFAGSKQDVLWLKQHEDPPNPADLAPKVDRRLCELCVELLSATPRPVQARRRSCRGWPKDWPPRPRRLRRPRPTTRQTTSTRAHLSAGIGSSRSSTRAFAASSRADRRSAG